MNDIFKKLKSNYKNEPEVSKRIYTLIDKLRKNMNLKNEEFLYILDNITSSETECLYKNAYEAKYPFYQNKVFLRGLIEISNYCNMGCLYCGINKKSKSVKRYRLSIEEIVECCKIGYELGYRTFVFQSGEDSYHTDEFITKMVSLIKKKYSDIRITLSLGERSKDSYQKIYDAGADRYLLRHEAASKRLYEHIHPSYMSFDSRRACLKDLKEIGYQVGGGLMVGIPSQTNSDLVEDLVFLKELNPQMIGIGPYLCHEETELKGNDSGTLVETLVMVALTRLILPKALLPATTALGSINRVGREMALNAGANVMMPNISPSENRALYEIYQNKICVTDTNEKYISNIEKRISEFGHVIDFSVGDYIDFERNE